MTSEHQLKLWRERSKRYRENHRSEIKERRNLERENELSKAKRRTKEGWAKETIRRIKHRAKTKGIEFKISSDDLELPDFCPVLGIEIRYGSEVRMSPNSPSVDRIDNSKGYLPDNIKVISNRANILKKDGTIEEMRKIVQYMIGENLDNSRI